MWGKGQKVVDIEVVLLLPEQDPTLQKSLLLMKKKAIQRQNSLNKKNILANYCFNRNYFLALNIIKLTIFMKNFNKKRSFGTGLMLTLVIALGGGCSLDPTDSKLLSEKNPELLMDSKLLLAKEILKASQDSEFRNFVLKGVREKFDGDYNFLLSNMNSKTVKARLFPNQNALINLISENQNFENGLQIYIPNFEEKANARTTNIDSEVTLVFQETNESIKEVDGYKLIDNELIKLDFKISEEFAKDNEVWVLGYNERIGLENYTSIDRNSRVLGAGEYIYQIQVPDLSEIEHWTAGAIELTARVATQKSGDALVYYYGDISRSDLKDRKWKTMNTFIANWTTTSIGDYMKVHWTERDGGDKNAIKIILTMPSSENVPVETKVEFTIDNLDDNLGHQMVQFIDSQTQIYSTGLISWKMKSI